MTTGGDKMIAFASLHFDIFRGYIKEIWLTEDDESGGA